jgi:hypothetical protein
MPARIIQNAIVGMDEGSALRMPTKQAIRKQIKRVRRENIPAEPNSLDRLEIPEDLKQTLLGEPFLIQDSTIGIYNSIYYFAKIIYFF